MTLLENEIEARVARHNQGQHETWLANCPMCRKSKRKIKFPIAYEGYSGTICLILRWGYRFFRDRRLVVRNGVGHETLIGRQETIDLLGSLKIEEGDLE
jgi:hypothetical protein